MTVHFAAASSSSDLRKDRIDGSVMFEVSDEYTYKRSRSVCAYIYIYTQQLTISFARIHVRCVDYFCCVMLILCVHALALSAMQFFVVIVCELQNNPPQCVYGFGKCCVRMDTWLGGLGSL